jgi:2-polyprenyl-3-methyl-5-hydroxy-6-metoxy-1,4-benzoquinol methylase
MDSAENTVSVSVPSPYVAPLLEGDYLIRLIAEITSRPSEEVEQRLQCEKNRLGYNIMQALREWKIEPHVWSDRLAKFYEGTDAFLYDSLVWNMTPTKNDMRRWIAEFLAHDLARPSRVLSFGDGLGFDSLYLAQAGHEVTYFEVSRDCAAFASRIFADADARINVVSTFDSVQSTSYDAVVCLDVLEHIPQPDQVVGLLASVLRPGGCLIVHAPFWNVHAEEGTHLKSNLTFSGDIKRLYAPHGLAPVAGRLFWDPIVLRKYTPEASTGAPRERCPAAIKFGGLLLRAARVSRLPHLVVAKLLFRRDQRYLRRTDSTSDVGVKAAV